MANHMAILLATLLAVAVHLASAQNCARGKAANIALGRPTKQSSTYRSYPSRLAVDGNRNPTFAKLGCTHTNTDTNPWWMVDLGSPKAIGTIVITNRGDCCANRLQKIGIYIGNTLSTKGGIENPQIKGSPFNPAIGAGRRPAFSANGMVGRYVYIRLNYKAVLTMCEVEITEFCPKPCFNLAYRQPASQSTTAWKGYAYQAVDGDAEPQYNARSCTHTAGEANPWWRVDLGMSRSVSMVRITNRGDCCPDRLNGFEIRLGDDPTKGYAVCNTGDNEKFISTGATATFKCSQLGQLATTQYVYIFLPGSGKVLTLCEVEVFENCNPTCNNVALKKKVSMSSYGWGGVGSRAVDGNTNGRYGGNSCSHTKNSLLPEWLMVDLGREYQVSTIGLANRADCCYTAYKNVQLTIGNNAATGGRFNPTCRWPKNQRPLGVTQYQCGSQRGRYAGVIEWTKGTALVLCEVQVCGYPLPNSAIGKNAWLSSTKTGSSPYNAIDGNNVVSNAVSRCAVTNQQDQPYLRVDLGELRQVTSVHITPVADKGIRGQIKNKALISVSTDPDFTNHIACGNMSTYSTSATDFNIVCNSGTPVAGRYVEIKLIAAAGVTLGICEFEIYTAKPVECKLSGFQGRRCRTPCAKGSGGIGCTACPSAIFGSFLLSGTKKCIRPKGGVQFPLAGELLEWTDKCDDPSAQFALTPKGAIQHTASGLCVIPVNNGATQPLEGSTLKLDKKCTDDNSVFNLDPNTKQLTLDKYFTLCLGPFKRGIPVTSSDVTLAKCTGGVGIFSAWQVQSVSVNQWQPAINIATNDRRFYYYSDLWTAPNPAYFGSAMNLKANAFLPTYSNMKVNALSVTLGSRTFNFTLPTDMAGKYTLRDLVMQRKLKLESPSFQGNKNMFALTFTGTATSQYYCGDYGFSQRLFTGVKNDMQCQGMARIGVTTSFKTQYGPVQTFNGKCWYAGAVPKVGGQVLTSSTCYRSDATYYFYMTTDGYIKHSRGLCVTGSSGAKIGSKLVMQTCAKSIKWAYDFGGRTLTPAGTKYCVRNLDKTPGNNRPFSIVNSCTDRVWNYLTWLYPTDSASTPCQRVKPLSAEGVGLTTGCLTLRNLASGNLQGENPVNPVNFFSKATIRVLGIPFCQNNASCNSVLGTCDCPAGYYGQTCSLPCPSTLYGIGCRSSCNCKNGAKCDPATGACTCAAGFTGSDCSITCPANTYGVGCQPCSQCLSSSSNGCDPKTGVCSCLAGYAGVNCQLQCNDANGFAAYLNRYGVNCASKCRCSKDSTCNAKTGACTCNAGFTGRFCTSTCAKGTYGLNCARSCACLNGAACNSVDGTCTCTSGVTGANCGTLCSAGLCGLHCGSTCTCSSNGVCDVKTCGCSSCNAGYTGALCNKACPAGKYGVKCSKTCSCKNGATCNNVDGSCTCAAGWQGLQCDLKCPLNTYGVGCQPCSCVHGKCNVASGACDCDPGYAGPKCDTRCKSGSFGLNCSQTCHCKANYVNPSAAYKCDTVTGKCNCIAGWFGACDQTCSDPFALGLPCGSASCNCTRANAVSCDGQTGICDCKPGYALPRCTSLCPAGKWGQNCVQSCHCNTQNSKCDPITGFCSCTAGYVGHTCAFTCPQGAYGINCTQSCNCVEGTCDPTNGVCSCLPGYTGVKCDQPCPTGMFGAACASTCSCANGTCNPVTGACICNTGFTGLNCDQKCPPGKYGSGCLLLCPNCLNSAHGTGGCNPTDGTCICQAGWRGGLCADTCADGTYGLNCAMPCTCSGSPCNSVSGVCACKPGTMGATCATACPAGTFGVGCTNNCTCFNGGSCNAADGSCVCTAGYYGAYCAEVCPANHYGAQCSKTCSCGPAGTCSPVDGKCVCDAGFTGATCTASLKCPAGKYGSDCNLNCECMNQGSCNPINGMCTCTDGFSGVKCEESCPLGRFGKNCASVCQCVNGVCQSTNGSCVCSPGFKGSKCTLECAVGTWGSGCTSECLCTSQQTCDVYTGSCTDAIKSASDSDSGGANTVAIVVPIVVVLVVLGLVIVFIVHRSAKKIEKKMPAGMFTADEADISYGPGAAQDEGMTGMTNPTYASPENIKQGLVQEE